MWTVAIIVVIICVLLTVIKIFLGPGTPTRFVAFDTLNTLVVALMVVLAVVFEQVIFVDIAIVYAVLSFIMTLYVARLLGGKKF